MENKSIHRMAHLTVKENHIEELIILFKDLVQQTRQENGCIQMELYQNKNQPAEFVFVSEFVDVKAFELHDSAKWHKEILNKLSGKIVGVPHRNEYINLT
jgi:quinol monooxygenase YgiN